MNHLVISEEVRAALQDGRPVVALESTIIAHGMPFPRNVETAFMVEQTVRAAGAVPATCAILKGKLTAGLTEDQIGTLGKRGAKIPKASRRDLPYLISKGQDGATTVAATMIVAHLAGIRMFATGGIGGVHRGATTTLDVSADLQELAQTPVAVVSAGAKRILDLGLTLEYLETHGVPVLGYQTDEFPGFYSRQSGFGVDYRLDTPKEMADLLKAKWEMGLRGGVVIANPVPEQYQLDDALLEETILQALQEANQLGIRGKNITPFLLAKVERLTHGESLHTNIQLVLNNARLAAEIAGAF
jgi:pseudouridine-5'-phosphate glycosidase